MVDSKKLERWGAYILGHFEDSFGVARGTVYAYEVRIGKYDKQTLEKGEMFTTNPRISERIATIQKKLDFKGKLPVGHIAYGINRGRKEIEVFAYYPFPRC